jgi:putative oxidoreductase
MRSRISSCTDVVRRLFWTYPDGLPGAGLLLMRVATGGALLYRAVAEWSGEPLRVTTAWAAGEGVSAVLLLAGFATPLSGAFTAALELWRAGSQPAEFLVHGLLAALGASLALLGPGAMSVDAWRFGWRRIDVGEIPPKGPIGRPNE